jgi:uncharacterized protein (DUF1697 family)
VSRYAAFLRAVNVGGHNVKMEALRGIVASLGLADVETFIASGNVVFRTDETDTAELGRRLSEALAAALDYEVAAFVRSLDEVAAIAAHEAFAADDVAAAAAFNVAFTGAPVNADEDRRLQALATDLDRFHTHGREVYWLCAVRQSQSTFSNAALEKALGRPSTLRSHTTVARIADRWGS